MTHEVSTLKILRSPLPCGPAGARVKLHQHNITQTELVASLISLIISGTLTLEDEERLSPFCKHLSLTSDQVETLASLVQDTKAPARVRHSALAMFYYTERGFALNKALSAHDRALLCLPWVRAMMRINNLFARQCIDTLYASTPLDARDQLIQTFSEARVQVNAPMSVFSQLKGALSADHETLLT